MQFMSYCSIETIRTFIVYFFVYTIKNRQCLPVQEYYSIIVANVSSQYVRLLIGVVFHSDCVVYIMFSIGCPLGIWDPKLFGTFSQFMGLESSAVKPGLPYSFTGVFLT